MQGFLKIIEKCYVFFKNKKKYQCQSVIGNSALFLQPTHSLFTPKMAIYASYFAEMEFFFYKLLEGEFYIATTHKSCFYIEMSKTIQKPNGMKDIYL